MNANAFADALLAGNVGHPPEGPKHIVTLFVVCYYGEIIENALRLVIYSLNLIMLTRQQMTIRFFFVYLSKCIINCIR